MYSIEGDLVAAATRFYGEFDDRTCLQTENLFRERVSQDSGPTGMLAVRRLVLRAVTNRAQVIHDVPDLLVCLRSGKPGHSHKPNPLTDNGK